MNNFKSVFLILIGLHIFSCQKEEINDKEQTNDNIESRSVHPFYELSFVKDQLALDFIPHIVKSHLITETRNDLNHLLDNVEIAEIFEIGNTYPCWSCAETDYVEEEDLDLSLTPLVSLADNTIEGMFVKLKTDNANNLKYLDSELLDFLQYGDLNGDFDYYKGFLEYFRMLLNFENPNVYNYHYFKSNVYCGGHTDGNSTVCLCTGIDPIDAQGRLGCGTGICDGDDYCRQLHEEVSIDDDDGPPGGGTGGPILPSLLEFNWLWDVFEDVNPGSGIGGNGNNGFDDCWGCNDDGNHIDEWTHLRDIIIDRYDDPQTITDLTNIITYICGEDEECYGNLLTNLNGLDDLTDNIEITEVESSIEIISKSVVPNPKTFQPGEQIGNYSKGRYDDLDNGIGDADWSLLTPKQRAKWSKKTLEQIEDGMIDMLFRFAGQTGLEFFNHFKNGNKEDLFHRGLNEYCLNKTSTDNFIKFIGEKINERFNDTSCEADCDLSIVIPLSRRPQYGGSKLNPFNYKGIILINDTMEGSVHLQSHSGVDEDTGEWTAQIYIEITDHFGLDRGKGDLDKDYIHGIVDWWLLQWDYGYNPFRTKIKFLTEIKGNIND